MCDFVITSLDYNNDAVILGGMFFQEFYGFFTNDYGTGDYGYYGYDVKQTVQLYIQESSLYAPSISNVTLLAGPNPFSPNTPSAGISTTLLIAIIVGGALMLILLAVLIMCCCKDKQAQLDDDALATIYSEPLKPAVNDSVVDDSLVMMDRSAMMNEVKQNYA